MLAKFGTILSNTLAVLFVVASMAGFFSPGEQLTALCILAAGLMLFTPIWKSTKLRWPARAFIALALGTLGGALIPDNGSKGTTADAADTAPGGAATTTTSAASAASSPKPAIKKAGLLTRFMSPSSVADAESWVLGEWTADAKDRWADAETGYWEYLRFEDTGTVLWCMALASEDTWSRCERARYSIERDRYVDTGKDYLRIKMRESSGLPFLPGTTFIIDGREILVRRNGDTYPPFTRGNSHPHAPSP